MAQDALDDFRRFNERGFQTDPEHDFRERMRRHLENVHMSRNDPHPYVAWEHDDIDWGDRMPPREEYDKRSEKLLRLGIQVRTRVKFDTFTPKNPLLVIEVDKLPEWNYTDWVSNATINPSVHRHVSIIYWDDLVKIDDWEHKVDELYKKFDHKNLWLYGNWVTNGGTLVLDPERDPIASDPIVQEFHSTMKKWNKDEDGNWIAIVPDMHISM